MMDNINGQLMNGQVHIKSGYNHEDRNSKNGSNSSTLSPTVQPTLNPLRNDYDAHTQQLNIFDYHSDGHDAYGSPSSMPYEKSKMIDITRDKPIKIAVRVAVPVRDHPKFNFVGKLLGPKGNSLKRLQEETMCKMSVLGRGSMRDRKKEEELRLSGEYKYSHLSEDLHVEISTFAPPAEAHARIAYALAEVRRFLVPDHHDDIRQEQKWEMQALSSSQSNANGSCHSADDANEHNGLSDASSETGTTEHSCASHMENGSSNQHINNNTIAINNNNCDTIKNNNQTVTAAPLDMVNDVETVPAAVTLIDQQQNALLRSVNIAGSLGRKRPLLCSTRNINNPTKRTVMTLLARAKTANALHGFHPNGPSITDSLQLLTSPLIIPPTLEHVLQAGAIPAALQQQTSNAQSIKQENILQGA